MYILIPFLSKIITSPVVKITKENKINAIIDIILHELAPTNPGTLKTELFRERMKKSIMELLGF